MVWWRVHCPVVPGRFDTPVQVPDARNAIGVVEVGIALLIAARPSRLGLPSSAAP
jgi:hypothetical protein